MIESAESSGTISVGDGLELFFERRGTGPALVVPSLSWLARDMTALAPGHTVVFYDIRGRGRSSAIFDEEQLGIENDVRDLELLRVALGLERMSLLGWSYHGALAARYTLARPDRVERLLMIGPTAPAMEPYWMEFLERFGASCDLDSLRRLDTLRKQGVKQSDPLAWCRAVHDAFFRAYVHDAACLERMRSCPCVEPNLDADRVNDQGRRVLEKLGKYDWRSEFTAFATPTLLIHGREDPVALSGSEDWQRILSSSRLEVLDDVGHLPWLEAPERFFALANEFLDADGAGASNA